VLSREWLLFVDEMICSVDLVVTAYDKLSLELLDYLFVFVAVSGVAVAAAAVVDGG
jgi:hypothetical protein